MEEEGRIREIRFKGEEVFENSKDKFDNILFFYL